MPKIAIVLVFLATVLSTLIPAAAQVGIDSSDDSPDKDYATELPRIPPKSPAEALEAFEVLPGFEVQLVAAEPLVNDPVAFAFDARGRLFVVEMLDYSEQETESLGRIALLTDADGDGVMDERTTYAEGLSWPTACWPWRDGVLVAEPPRITWYRDTDGDGRSDVQEEWFAGFGRSNVQGLVNSLRWGVDGNIHGATSSSGADIESAVASGNDVNLGRRDFSIDPLTKEIHPESGGGQHGLSFNRWGEKFVTSNSDHLQQVIDLDAWLSQHANAVVVPSTRRSIAEDGPQAEVFRASPIEPWRIVRTRLRVSGMVPGPVEGGGRAAGYFTGATGTWIVDRELRFGEGAETALVCDVGSNLVHRKRMIDHGLFWSAQRIDENSELLRSSDTWFRPVQLGDGPDGAIYIADMVREVIEHPKSLPPMIKKHLDLTSGRDRGRIWRLSTTTTQLASDHVDLTSLTGIELVERLGHPIPWQRRMASQLLVERADPSTRQRLVEFASKSAKPESRVLALHVAHRLNWFTEDLAQTALQDAHPRVLEHAITLIGRSNTVSGSSKLSRSSMVRSLQMELSQLTAIDSPRVQLALAEVAAQMDAPARLSVLARLMPSATNPLVCAVMGTAAGDESWKLFGPEFLGSSPTSAAQRPGVDPEMYARWLPILLPVWAKQATKDPKLNAWLRSQLSPQNLQISNWLDSLCGLSSRSEAFAILNNLSADEQSMLFAKIESELGESVDAKHIQWVGLLPESSQTRWLENVLTPSAAETAQESVIRALAWSNHPQLPELLTSRFTSMTPSVQQNSLRVLTARAESLSYLAAALEEQRILPAHIPADLRQRMISDRDARLAKRFQAIFSGVSADRQQVIDKYAVGLANIDTASLEEGQAAFARVCAQCHRIADTGNDVGPPLKSLADKSPLQLLQTILDPNREVDPKYSSYTVLLQDGRVIAGIIRDESSAQIVLVEAGGAVHSIPRDEIEQLKSNGISFMPVGFEEQVTPEQLTALIKFVRSSSQ